jgi:hypothetical protein
VVVVVGRVVVGRRGEVVRMERTQNVARLIVVAKHAASFVGEK